jgi:hypothetical protein
MNGFYDLLEKIKKRPSMYLGKRSISHLQVFLDAYTFARRELDIPVTEQEREFEEFQEWVEQRFNQASTQSWARIILFYAEDERDALERFFELFEEFLQRNKNVETEQLKVQI